MVESSNSPRCGLLGMEQECFGEISEVFLRSFPQQKTMNLAVGFSESEQMLGSVRAKMVIAWDEWE